MFLLAISNWGGYWPVLPAPAMWYPDSAAESHQVEVALMRQTTEDASVFHHSDAGVAPMFAAILPESEDEIKLVANRHAGVILLLKVLLNRPRPMQRNPYVLHNRIPSISAGTPAFPSGHSTQSFVVAQHYSQVYPHLREQLYRLAAAIGQSRVKAGHHYPSDHEAGAYLARLLGT